MLGAPFPSPPPGQQFFQNSTILPVGAVIAFAGKIGPPVSSPPANSPDGAGTGPHVTEPIEAWGWMVCDGRSLDISLYPELFAVLGFQYGQEGNDKFRIPDYRGYFLRGVDGGSGHDPGSSRRCVPQGGSGKPEEVGSKQNDALQTHEHIYKSVSAAAVSGEGAAAGTPPGEDKLTSHGPTSSLSPPGDVKVSTKETRPVNIYVNYIIKFTQ